MDNKKCMEVRSKDLKDWEVQAMNSCGTLSRWRGWLKAGRGSSKKIMNCKVLNLETVMPNLFRHLTGCKTLKRVQGDKNPRISNHTALSPTPSLAWNSSRSALLSRQKVAFTLAEVVITLIVIGVVSAVTIPMLNNDVNDKKWNVARQKAQATIGEAFKLATINGYVTPDYDNTKDFTTKVLTKYLKINKQCDIAVDCGFSSQVKRADGKSQRAIPTSWTDSTTAYILKSINGSGYNNKALYNSVDGGIRAKFNDSTFFQTLDGLSVAFFFNPYCAIDEKDKYWRADTYNKLVTYMHFPLDIACMNAVYDMNGKQGPNRVGQDIGFVGSFYNSYSVKAVAVLPYKNQKIADNNLPNSNGSDYWLRAQQYCKALHENNWKVPDIEELDLMYLNHNILKTDTNYLWTSVRVPGDSRFARLVNFGIRGYYFDSYTFRTYYAPDGYGSVLCVRTNALK